MKDQKNDAIEELVESIKNYFLVYENKEKERGWIKRVGEAKSRCFEAIRKAEVSK